MVNFSLVKKGYDPTEVDAYIKKLEDVVVSYKEKDVAIKNAIVSAQIAADNIIKNAELQAMSNKVKAIEDLKDIQINILSEKNKLETFNKEYNELIRKYLIPLDKKEVLSVNNRIDEIAKDFDDIQNKLTGQKEKEDAEGTKKIPTLNSLKEMEDADDTIKIPTMGSLKEEEKKKDKKEKK